MATCKECGSCEFSTADEGERVCIVCATVYIGNVNEATDEGFDAVLSQPAFRRRIVRRFISQPSKIAPAPEVKLSACECLRCLQSILCEMSCSLCKLIDGESKSSSLHNVVKMFWVSLMKGWTSSGSYPIAAYFQDYYARLRFEKGRASKRQRTPSNSAAEEKSRCPLELVEPSMPTLVAILYLSCRWVQNGIVPIDLVRWCRDGSIPFLKGLELVPAELRNSAKRLESLFTPLNVPSSSSITSTCHRVAAALGVVVPTLNCVAVGHRFAYLLKFPMPKNASLHPSRVLQNFCLWASIRCKRLNHIFEDPSPMHIMALLVLIIRMCPWWLEWVGVPQKQSPRVPQCEEDLTRFERKFLDDYMNLCERSLVKPLTTMNGGRSQNKQHGSGLVEALKSIAAESRHISFESGEVKATAKEGIRTTLQGDDDLHLYGYFSVLKTGKNYDMSYCTLIERCAAHMEVAPFTLNHLVMRIERLLLHHRGTCENK